MLQVFIEPHERGEALDAYADWLTMEQVHEIEDAPETALVRLCREIGGKTTVLIIPEG